MKINNSENRSLSSKISFDDVGNCLIFGGTFYLVRDYVVHEFDGKVFFSLKNNQGLNFQGTQVDGKYISSHETYENPFFLKFDNYYLKYAHITYYSFGNEVNIKGRIWKYSLIESPNITFHEISFFIPNFKKIQGKQTKLINSRNQYEYINRAIFDDDEYFSIMDEIHHPKLEENSIELTHLIKVQKKDQSKFNAAEISLILEKVSYFFSFVNGRGTSPSLVHSNENDKLNFIHFLPKSIPVFTHVDSWNHLTMDTISDFWTSFGRKFSLHSEVLKLSINWYLEANSKAFNLDSAIVISQANLELLTNWLIFEEFRILEYGDDIERMYAANKFRLLLNFLKIPVSIPEGLYELTKEENLNSEIKDGPSAITFLRNKLVHPKEKNRLKLNSVTDEIKDEILRISSLYVELTLLNIFDYEGIFWNRCNYFYKSDGNLIEVPWIKTKHA